MAFHGIELYPSLLASLSWPLPLPLSHLVHMRISASASSHMPPWLKLETTRCAKLRPRACTPDPFASRCRYTAVLTVYQPFYAAGPDSENYGVARSLTIGPTRVLRHLRSKSVHELISHIGKVVSGDPNKTRRRTFRQGILAWLMHKAAEGCVYRVGDLPCLPTLISREKSRSG